MAHAVRRRLPLFPACVAAGLAVLFALLGDRVLVVRGALERLPVESPLSLDTALAGASAALGVVPPHGPIPLPLTLVDLDEPLFAAWGRPCVTPRPPLLELLRRIAAQRPRAILLDVNLACGADDGSGPAGSAALDAWLRTYPGPAPLILVRPLHVEAAGGERGAATVRADATPFDDAVRTNPHLRWAHTFYVSDEDGVVRRWRERWTACGPAGPEEVPAAALQLVASDGGAPAAARGAEPPHGSEHGAAASPCAFEGQRAPAHLVLLGARILGRTRDLADAAAPRVVPARQLLDDALQVAPGGWFALDGRVVVIGATHSGSGDVFRTALGSMAGMELIAQTARFAPLQLARRPLGTAATRALALVAFAVLAACFFVLRPLWAIPLALVLLFALIAVAVAGFGRTEVLGAIESALWLFVMHELVLAGAEIVADSRRFAGWRKLRVALLSEKWLKHEEHGGHE